MNLNKSISIVLPTYNEVNSIIDLIDVLNLIMEKQKYDGEIIVVDDNSKDGTSEAIIKKSRECPSVKAIIRQNERGLATAIKRGIAEAKGEIIIIMDTDFNHDPFKVPEFVSLLDHYQIVSGSRYVWGGSMMGSRWRYWGSYWFNVLIRSILRMPTKDNLSGFVAFKKSILRDFNIDDIFRGYGEYYIRFLWAARNLHLSLIEVPVVYKMRQGGESKTSFIKYVFIYFMTILELRFSRLNIKQ